MKKLFFLFIFTVLRMTGFIWTSEPFLASWETINPCHPALKMIRQAEERYLDCCYDDAVSCFEQSLELIDHYKEAKLSAAVRLKLSQALLYAERLTEAKAILDTFDNELLNEKIPYNYARFMKGLLALQKQEYQKAYIELRALYKECPDNKHPLYFDALFLLGHSCMRQNYFTEAQAVIDLIQKDKEAPPHIVLLSRLTEAEMALAQNCPHQTLALICKLQENNELKRSLVLKIDFLAGKAHYEIQEFSQAVYYFEKVLESIGEFNSDLKDSVLYQLGWAFLKQASLSQPPDESSFIKAESAFETLCAKYPKDRYFLALGNCYLTMGKQLNCTAYFEKVRTLLAKKAVFISQESQLTSLLLRAEAENSYSKREELYREMTRAVNQSSSQYIKGWIYRGRNEINEAKKLLNSNKQNEAAAFIERAVNYFNRAYTAQYEKDPSQSVALLKEEMEALLMMRGTENKQKVLSRLESCFDEIKHSKDGIDLYFIYGLASFQLMEIEESQAETAIQYLKKGIYLYKDSFDVERLLHLLASIYQKQKAHQLAYETFLQLAQDYPKSRYAPESLFAAACNAELAQNPPECSRDCRTKLWQHYPSSPLADEAYFYTYTYQDYLEGEKEALAHLEAMAEHFANSPYLVNAYYLLGLDLKRNRKSPEGKKIRKKNLTAAIDAFHRAELCYQHNCVDQKYSEDKQHYWKLLQFRATLERALSNLKIANESQGAKKQIYLEYSEDVLKTLAHRLKNNIQGSVEQDDYMEQLYEESCYFLSQVYQKQGHRQTAEKTLSLLIAYFKQETITRGYYLALSWKELAKLAFENKQYQLALERVLQAEDAAKGNVLSVDEKLELSLQKSLCYKYLNDYDTSMLLLSRVINSDTISGLRVKAMYLRAELYEMQGRKELALKQLEATAQKGGEWASKAKQKLKELKGYGQY